MPISSSLVTLFSMIGILVGLRIVLFKVFQPTTDLSEPSSETMGRASEEPLPPVSVWTVVVLVGVIVALVAGLVVFGNAIGG